MSIAIDSKLPNENELLWCVFSNFITDKSNSKNIPNFSYFPAICQEFDVNWILCACWCATRTNFWNDRNCRTNKDYGNIGGYYQDQIDNIRAIALEFSGFTSTDELVEQEQVEKLYNDFIEFSSKFKLPKITEIGQQKIDVQRGKIIASIACSLLTILSNLLPRPFSLVTKVVSWVLRKIFIRKG